MRACTVSQAFSPFFLHASLSPTGGALTSRTVPPGPAGRPGCLGWQEEGANPARPWPWVPQNKPASKRLRTPSVLLSLFTGFLAMFDQHSQLLLPPPPQNNTDRFVSANGEGNTIEFTEPDWTRFTSHPKHYSLSWADWSNVISLRHIRAANVLQQHRVDINYDSFDQKSI